MNAIEQTNTYSIPAHVVGQLRSKFEKLEKRAAKLGVPAPTMVVGEESENREWQKGQYLGFRTILITGEPVTLEGYEFVAVLEPTEDDQGNVRNLILRTPGSDPNINLDFFIEKPHECDHCGYNRRRSFTYVVVNIEDGDKHQVGSTCMRDFLGTDAHNPNAIARYFEQFHDLLNSAEDYEKGEPKPGDNFHSYIKYATEDFLAAASCAIRNWGYQKAWFESPSGYMERNPNSTVEKAWDIIREEDYLREEGIVVTEQDIKIARETIHWGSNLNATNEFEENLVTVARAETVPDRGQGFLAYLPEAFRRSFEKKDESPKENCPAGKQTISGEVIKTDTKWYGDDAREVMTVRDDRGFAVWGTVPRVVSGIQRGERVTFEATIEPSDRPTFGFFKRPRNAERIN